MKVSEMMNRLFGYDEISIVGEYPEHFLNAAANEDAEIWHIRRTDTVTLTARTRVFDRKKIIRIAGQCRSVRLNFLESRGLPPLLKRYRMRYGLFAGALFIALFVWIMSCFVWSVRISGNREIPTEQVTVFLENCGLKPGSLASAQDIGRIKNSMMFEFGNLAHVSINIKGSLAMVEITERTMPPAIDDATPCNIVAAKSGQIVLLEAYEGIPYFKPGDSVKQGQLLVGGVFDSKVVGYRTVHASAKVLARTKHSFSVTGRYAYCRTEATGRQKQRYSLILFGKEIPLYISDKPFDFWQEETEQTDLSIGDAVLPVTLKKTVCQEITQTEAVYTKEELTEILQKEIAEKERISLQGMTVEDRKIDLSESSEGITVESLYTIIEEIGVRQEIFKQENQTEG